MRHDYAIEWGEVSLAPLSEEESLSLRMVRNAAKDCFVSAAEVNEEQQIAWYRSYLEKPGDYMFSIHYKDELAGQLGLYGVDKASRTAEFGRIVVNPAFAGKQVGTRATQAACALAFAKLGVLRVVLEVFEDNITAIRCYERAGFIPMGTATAPDGRQMITMAMDKAAFEAAAER